MLYIFDKDNTLVYGYPGRPANSVEEQHLLPNVELKCARLRAEGHALAIASNQGGIASGYVSEAAVIGMLLNTAVLIGAITFRYCPHSSQVEECDCRKPRPGMLLKIMAQLRFRPQETVFVGDAETDRAAAEAAGIGFVWAGEFFDWPEDFNTILEEK